MSTATPYIERSDIPSTPISSGVLGMIFLLTTECMLFAGFISAYIVNRAQIPQWIPANQPRLPIEVTAINTLILIASGVMYFVFARRYRSSREDKNHSILLLTSMLLGLTFLLIQGSEWLRLIGYGLNSNTNLYAAFFYLIIGAHAVHVIAGMAILFFLWIALRSSRSRDRKASIVTVCGMYWAFVVAVWPLLYYLVYLMP